MTTSEALKKRNDSFFFLFLLQGCCKITELVDLPARGENVTAAMRQFRIDGLVSFDSDESTSISPTIRMMPIVTLSSYRDGTEGSFLFAVDHPDFDSLGSYPVMESYGIAWDALLHSSPKAEESSFLSFPTVSDDGVISLTLSYSQYDGKKRKFVDVSIEEGYYGVYANTTYRGTMVREKRNVHEGENI